MGDDAAPELETLATAMVDGAAAAAHPSPSPSPSSPCSSGASPSPSSPRTKRRRTDQYALGFEFAPRLAPYEVLAPRAGPEWTERSTYALLDAWGDRFVRAGRSGLRADEWLEVARLTSAATGRPAGYFSETHCRNRIDTLRKKFKKEREKVRLANRRSRPSPFGPLKWVYYDKMVSILCPSSPPPPPPLLPPPFRLPFVKRRRDTQTSPRLGWGTKAPECLLGCGGEARPGVSGLGAELGEPEPQKISAVEGNRNGFMALTESIQKFGEIFARMESSKRRHMAEVEQMRRDLQRDLDAKWREIFARMESSKRRHMAEVEQMRRDLQRDLDAKWREILEKAQAEIACLSDEDGDEGDAEEDGGRRDDKRLEDGGGEEQNNGAMDGSPQHMA